jgi:hypothetical protein
MTINTNLTYAVEVFGTGEYPIDETLLSNITFEQARLVKEMMSSGFYQDGLYVNKFIRPDHTINLDLLEFAVTLTVLMLEANSDNDTTLKLKGLQQYYNVRGIYQLADREREERTFLLGFITAVAAEASRRDTLEVKFVNES